MVEFGRLESVDLRSAWPNEARDFTPWLAKNLDRLREVIGIELELENTEVSVEQYAADIVARNPSDDSIVLIENQLEWTDHTHLGQVLTYLAGLNAQTVVWVAREFTSAHLSAIRWLNEHTVDPFAFFAVRVSVVKVGDSPLVPIFEVLERPNDWDRRIRARQENNSELSGNSKLRHDFWEFYRQNHPDAPRVRPGYRGNNVYENIESLTISPYISVSGVGIYLRDRGSSIVAEQSALVHRCRDLLEERGVESWKPIELANPDNWPDMAHWLHDRLLEYREAIERVKSDHDFESTRSEVQGSHP